MSAWLFSFATISPPCIATMSLAIDLVSFVLGRLPSRSEAIRLARQALKLSSARNLHDVAKTVAKCSQGSTSR
jgi:hypothetical protein